MNGAQTVFVLGILPRSGTAFLSDLLCLYPGFGTPRSVGEDFFLYYSDRLMSFVDAVVQHWSVTRNVPVEHQAKLQALLGDGIVSFLAAVTPSGRVVTKTPRVDHLANFSRLFPNVPLLILVRDGRAVLESGIRSFGWNREAAMHRWRDAAQTILDFDATQRASGLKYLIVRYEDLWRDVEAEMTRILDFVGLDRAAYDFGAARALPLRGSSELRTEDGGELHWRPVAKPVNFDPLSRWKHWTARQVERFDWVAGPHLAAFGYERLPRTTHPVLWYLGNRIADLKWFVIRTLGPIWLRIKGRPRARTR